MELRKAAENKQVGAWARHILVKGHIWGTVHASKIYLSQV